MSTRSVELALFSLVFQETEHAIRGGGCYNRSILPRDKHMPTPDNIRKLVEQMLELDKQSTMVPNPLDKERVGREIESTDKSIDRLVYELYGLTEEEIKIVEGE